LHLLNLLNSTFKKNSDKFIHDCPNKLNLRRQTFTGAVATETKKYYFFQQTPENTKNNTNKGETKHSVIIDVAANHNDDSNWLTSSRVCMPCKESFTDACIKRGSLNFSFFG
jgi:hypothetical protein